MRVDWFHLITGLERAGISILEMAAHCGVTGQTIYNWKNGGEPRHFQGEALRTLYEHTVGLASPPIGPAVKFNPPRLQATAPST
jgi:hypothetical protein